MKTTTILTSIAVCCFALGSSRSYAQTLQDTPVSISTISAEQLGDLGSWQADLSSLVSVNFGGSNIDGTKLGSNSGQTINLRGIGGAVAPNLIVTGDLTFNRQLEEIEVLQGPTSTTQYGIDVHAGYKLDFVDETVYGGVNLGYGGNKFKDESSESTFEATDNILSYGVELGKYTDIGEAKLYTSIDYNIESISFDQGDQTCNTFGVNANLIEAMTCGEFDLLHNDNGASYGDGRRDQGSRFLEGSSGLWFSTGTLTDTYEFAGESFESKTNKSFAQLAFGGGYYLLNDLAGLFALQYERNSSCLDDSDYSVSNSEFSITVGAQAHASLFGLDKLQNVYFSAKGEFGSQGNSSDIGGQSVSSSQGFTMIGFGPGVDHHITQSVFLSSYVEYWMCSQADSDVKQNNLVIGGKLRTNF